MNPSEGNAPQKRPDPGDSGFAGRKPPRVHKLDGLKASAHPGDGMMSFRSKPRLVRAMLAAMVGAAVIAGGSGQTAWAADDDEEEPLIDTKIVRHILQGLGWQREEKQIEYRERSPLVRP